MAWKRGRWRVQERTPHDHKAVRNGERRNAQRTTSSVVREQHRDRTLMWEAVYRRECTRYKQLVKEYSTLSHTRVPQWLSRTGCANRTLTASRLPDAQFIKMWWSSSKNEFTVGEADWQQRKFPMRHIAQEDEDQSATGDSVSISRHINMKCVRKKKNNLIIYLISMFFIVFA